jgi:predicted SAM-dependent methyltransferase
MSIFDRSGGQATAEAAQLDPLPVFLDVRAVFADRFLFGEGLEIGPLHQPLAIPPHARARYVDRMTTADLCREYPEVADWDLTEVDVVDDGERLATIAEQSQDFIVANHFLEHTEDPIGTIETHLGKLKPGGVLFYAVPDKRFTFDFRRPVTPIEHMVADHEEGPERSRSEHYREWCRLVIDEESDAVGSAEQAASEEWVERRARQLEDAKYSIHMHVWTQAEFLKLVLTLRERLDGAFDIEAAARVGIEFVVVLRKQGPLPPPPHPPPPAPEPPRGEPPGRKEIWKDRARRAAAAARNELRRRRARP